MVDVRPEGTRTTTWQELDTAGADNLGVDAVVYPGLLSDISLNDGGGGTPDRTGPISGTLGEKL